MSRAAFKPRFVFRNIETPDATARLTAVFRATDPAAITVSECCAGSQLWSNEQTSFGSVVAALAMQPATIMTLRGIRMVLDVDL